MLTFITIMLWLGVFATPLVMTLIRSAMKDEFKARPIVTRIGWLVAGLIVVPLILWGFGFWTKALWWAYEVHQAPVFWTRFWLGWKLFGLGAGVTFLVLALNSLGAAAALPLVKGKTIVNGRRDVRWGAMLVSAIIALIMGWALTGAWPAVLQFLHRVPFGVTDPIFGKDAGFYVFVLPLLQAFYLPLLIMTLIAAAMSAGIYLIDMGVVTDRYNDVGEDIEFPPGAAPAPGASAAV